MLLNFTIVGKFWYCRLSPNHKFLHFGDCDEDAKPTVEQLSKKGTFYEWRITLQKIGIKSSPNFETCKIITLLLICFEVAVVDIKSLLSGKDCPHIKEREKSKKVSLLFGNAKYSTKT